MMKNTFSVVTHIRASPTQVFWFLADPSTAPIIDPAVASYEPEDGTMGLGVANRIRIKITGSSTISYASAARRRTAATSGSSAAFHSAEPSQPPLARRPSRRRTCMC